MDRSRSWDPRLVSALALRVALTLGGGLLAACASSPADRDGSAGEPPDASSLEDADPPLGDAGPATGDGGHPLIDAGERDAGEGLPGATCDADARSGYYCAGDKVTGGATGTLYRCDGPGAATVYEACEHECVIAPAGDDDHCAADAAVCDSDARVGHYCAGDKVSDGTPDTLYYCDGPGSARVLESCAAGCMVGPPGSDDRCAAAATCDSDARTGYYCAGDKVSSGMAETLYACDGPGPATVREACAHGCVVAAPGMDDYCAPPGATCDTDASTGYYCAGDKVSGGTPGTLYRCDGPGSATIREVCADGCVVGPPGSDDYCGGRSGGGGYRLPFACGTTRTVTNGNDTSSHSGTDRYAYDFGLPRGTSVRAIRAGVVHRVRIVSTPGSYCYDGGGSSCANLANTVEVRHSDGSIGLYMHISRSSVRTGQRVSQGQEVARSGNSGWSTGPHLHLQVQTNCGIWWCQSRRFSFVEGSSLRSGRTVRSENCP